MNIINEIIKKYAEIIINDEESEELCLDIDGLRNFLDKLEPSTLGDILSDLNYHLS